MTQISKSPGVGGFGTIVPNKTVFFMSSLLRKTDPRLGFPVAGWYCLHQTEVLAKSFHLPDFHLAPADSTDFLSAKEFASENDSTADETSPYTQKEKNC